MTTPRLSSDSAMIAAIKRHPILYDTRLKEYRNKYEKEMTWKKVADELNVKAEDLVYRWKCIRDRYVRIRKRQVASLRNGTPAFPSYRSNLNKELSFLNNTISHRRTKSNEDSELIEGEPEAESSCSSLSFHLEDEENILGISFNNDMELENGGCSDPESASHLIPECNISENSILKKVKKETDEYTNDIEVGLGNSIFAPKSEDEYFALSLVDSLKSVPSGAKKVELKSKIWSLIAEYAK